MKILLTGGTNAHCRPSSVRMPVATGGNAIEGFLLSEGHEVDRRPVQVGEDLSGYDRVIGLMAHLTNMSSAHALGFLYTAAVREDTILVADDWQTKELAQSYDYVGKRPGYLFPGGKFEQRSQDHDPTELKRWQEPMEVVIRRISRKAEGLEPSYILASTWRRGDKSLLGLPTENVVGFDPSSLTTWYPVERPSMDLFAAEQKPRARAWVNPALLVNAHRWAEKQGFGWPVKGYGNKKLKQPRLTEAEVQLAMTENWGALASPYYHKGSGWWRPRYNLAAHGGAVTYCHPDEGAIFGDPFVFTEGPEAIEALTDAELTRLAQDQADCLVELIEGKAVVKATLSEYLLGAPRTW